jgi:Mn-containing catalase
MDVKQKAARARELLHNESFVKVMDDIKKEQVNRFLNSIPTDTELREQAHSVVNAIRVIESYLQSAITDEKVFDKKHNK